MSMDLIQREMEIELDADEKAQLEIQIKDKMAELEQEQSALEAEMQQVKAIRKSIAELNAVLLPLLKKWRDGRYTELMYIDVDYNTPEPGKKTLCCAAMRKTWVEDMTDEDKSTLFAMMPVPKAVPVLAKKPDQPDGADGADQPDDPGKCSVCGYRPVGPMYHLCDDKLICPHCLEQKQKAAEKKMEQKCEEAEQEHFPVKVRPQFGFCVIEEHADLTCFRFIFGMKHSWGSPIYIPGDYRKEGSPAANFYARLLDEYGMDDA